MESMKEIMSKLGLTVNEEKTKVVSLPAGQFTFLGYEVRNMYSWKLHKKYIGVRPSQKSIANLGEKVKAHTAANRGLLGASDVVKGLNKVDGVFNIIYKPYFVR
jgi:hypothetical protein